MENTKKRLKKRFKKEKQQKYIYLYKERRFQTQKANPISNLAPLGGGGGDISENKHKDMTKEAKRGHKHINTQNTCVGVRTGTRTASAHRSSRISRNFFQSVMPAA